MKIEDIDRVHTEIKNPALTASLLVASLSDDTEGVA